MLVTVAVEGDIDRAIVEAMARALTIELGPVHVTNGKAKLDRRIAQYNHAAAFAPWFVLRDLDQDAPCAPDLVAGLLPVRASQMLFRVAVRAAEAWLMADVDRLSAFLHVPPGRIPAAPDTLLDPKGTLVRLASTSRLKDIRVDMTPLPGRFRKVGPGYSARMIEFAQEHWRPAEAAKNSDSLARCIRALAR